MMTFYFTVCLNPAEKYISDCSMEHHHDPLVEWRFFFADPSPFLSLLFRLAHTDSSLCRQASTGTPTR